MRMASAPQQAANSRGCNITDRRQPCADVTT